MTTDDEAMARKGEGGSKVRHPRPGDDPGPVRRAPPDCSADFGRGGFFAERDARPVYWAIRDIQFHCRVSRSTAWRLVRSPGFPRAAVLSPKTVRWRRDEVEAFVDARRESAQNSAPEAPPVEATAYVARPVRAR
jgi:predicted DNA-binding transcriptional regulator AlpA